MSPPSSSPNASSPSCRVSSPASSSPTTVPPPSKSRSKWPSNSGATRLLPRPRTRPPKPQRRPKPRQIRPAPHPRLPPFLPPRRYLRRHRRQRTQRLHRPLPGLPLRRHFHRYPDPKKTSKPPSKPSVKMAPKSSPHSSTNPSSRPPAACISMKPACWTELLTEARRQGITYIADEVLTGFGRTGRFFAGEYLTQKADIICLSKGLTGGTMALGITAATEHIFEAFLSDDRRKTTSTATPLPPIPSPAPPPSPASTCCSKGTASFASDGSPKNTKLS